MISLQQLTPIYLSFVSVIINSNNPKQQIYLFNGFHKVFELNLLTLRFQIQFLLNILIIGFKVRVMFQMVNIYVLLTGALFSYTVYQQLQRSSGYFTAVLSYMANDMNVLILYNFAACIAYIFYKILTKIFFERTLQGQAIKITDRLKIKIFDVVLFSYIIGLKIDFQVYLVIVLLIFLYILHNNLAFRCEHLIHAHSTSISLVKHYKILALFFILFFFDYQILKVRALKILSINEPSEGILIYYMFEITMIIVEPFLQFIFDFYEKYTFSHIKNSQQILAISGLLINIPKLLIQLLMSLWIAYKFSQLAIVFISSFNILIQLKDAVQSYSRVRKLTNAMSLLKKLKGQQLQKFHDLTCTVCYDDMKDAVMLPCKHIFHQECMRQWIIKNLNHFCPKCKREFNFQRIHEEYTQHDGAVGQKAQFDHFKALFSNRGKEGEDNSGQNIQDQSQEQLREQKLEQQKQENTSQRQIKRSSFIKQSKRQTLFRQSTFGNRSKISPSKSQNAYKKKVIMEEGQDLSQYPLEFYEKMKKNVVRVGSLPYGLPTAAVNNRTHQHMKKRRQNIKQIDVILRLMNMSHNQQLLFL